MPPCEEPRGRLGRFRWGVLGWAGCSVDPRGSVLEETGQDDGAGGGAVVTASQHQEPSFGTSGVSYSSLITPFFAICAQKSSARNSYKYTKFWTKWRISKALRCLFFFLISRKWEGKNQNWQKKKRKRMENNASKIIFFFPLDKWILKKKYSLLCLQPLRLSWLICFTIHEEKPSRYFWDNY